MTHVTKQLTKQLNELTRTLRAVSTTMKYSKKSIIPLNNKTSKIPLQLQ